MNRRVFYDAIRSRTNWTERNVSGTERVLDYGSQRGTLINDLAYVLATAWWETGQAMQPVVEAGWLSDAWRRRSLRYYPWHGRGLIQTTWERNYRKMGAELGVDLIADPDLLLEWEYALPALFVGMEQGLYTGKSLDDYIDDIDDSDDEDLREYVAARRIVNGTDKAEAIGKLALRFEYALRVAGYHPRAVDHPPGNPVQSSPRGNDPPEPELPQARPPAFARFAAALAAFFMSR